MRESIAVRRKPRDRRNGPLRGVQGAGDLPRYVSADMIDRTQEGLEQRMGAKP
jgi:hypothetical protein